MASLTNITNEPIAADATAATNDTNGMTEPNGSNGSSKTSTTNGTHANSETNGTNDRRFEELMQRLNEINVDTFKNDGKRFQALLAAYSLMSRLETPWDFVLRLCMGQVLIFPLV